MFVAVAVLIDEVPMEDLVGECGGGAVQDDGEGVYAQQEDSLGGEVPDAVEEEG